jgi:ribonuclease P protein component
MITRLKKRADFVAMRGHTTVHGVCASVAIRPNGTQAIRVGYTVTKKLDNRAVVRNRVKRRLRAVVEALLKVHGVPGTDYLIIARSSMVSYGKGGEVPQLLLQRDLERSLDI